MTIVKSGFKGLKSSLSTLYLDIMILVNLCFLLGEKKYKSEKVRVNVTLEVMMFFFC